jgi:hypothetical protein
VVCRVLLRVLLSALLAVTQAFLLDLIRSVGLGVLVELLPILLPPLGAALVYIHGIEAIHDIARPLLHVVRRIHHHQNAAATHAFGVVLSFLLRNTHLGQSPHQAAGNGADTSAR